MRTALHPATLLNEQAPSRGRRVIVAGAEVVRFAGLAIGVFLFINVAGEVLRGPFDTLGDWVSLPLSPWPRRLLALAAAALLVRNGWKPIESRIVRRAGAILLGGIAGIAIADAARFFESLARGAIQTPALLPASLVVAAAVGVLGAELYLDRRPRAGSPSGSARRALLCATTCAVVAVALPLVRMATFGPTRYERRADCAVIFGARVWNDGTPSLALADRVDEGIRLYQRGLVGKLVMSGAIEPNGHSEPEVMRARAIEAGVPPQDIMLDVEGVDTGATVRNTARLMREERLQSALAVSHYYHEPRVKMLFDRSGVRVYTVPARMTRRLVKEPYFLLREVAAYYHSFLLE